MNVLEPNDPKEVLLKKTATYRHELEEEVKQISERTEKIITNALIIGGTLALAYILVRQFSEPSPKKKSGEKKDTTTPSKLTGEETPEAAAPSIVAKIGSALASHATVFLLTIAKEKLSEYLKSQFEKGNFNERT